MVPFWTGFVDSILSQSIQIQDIVQKMCKLGWCLESAKKHSSDPFAMWGKAFMIKWDQEKSIIHGTDLLPTPQRTLYRPTVSACCGLPFISGDWGILLNEKKDWILQNTENLFHDAKIWSLEQGLFFGRTLIPNIKPN